MGCTKAEIIKFNIMRIDAETIVGNRKSESTAYYDKNGNEIMCVMTDSNYKWIVYSEYKDSLLIKQIEVHYENDELKDSLLTNFLYEFDNKGRIIQSKIIKPSGETSIDIIMYNNSGKTDTTYYFKKSGNISKSKMTECCKYLYNQDTVITYCYDSLGWDSPNLKITKNTYSDTLWSHFIHECKFINNEIKNCKNNIVKLYLKDGRQIRYENEGAQALVEHFYEKDQQGLVIKHIMKSTHLERENVQISKFEYFSRH
jgi:hypothetical protein